MSFEKIEYTFPKLDVNIKIEDVLSEPDFPIPIIKELNRAIIKNIEKDNDNEDN